MTALVLVVQSYSPVKQELEDATIKGDESLKTSEDERGPVNHTITEEHEFTAEELFQFEPLSELEIAKAADSYRAQEKLIHHGQYELDNLEQIRLKNSDPLPNRTFTGVGAAEMCESGQAQCVQPFAKIRPLIVTSPNHHLMSCLIQKSMSTVMSAIFCFLVREKEFIDAGRSILREYPDIRLCEGKNEFKSVKDMQKGLHLQGRQFDKWHFTMVTREPVDRFLSGFIDRCIRAGQYAFADKGGTPRPKITMEDIHVFPQNWRCDMESYYDKYQFIRYSNDPSGSLLEDLTPLLRSQNVSESAINYISESLRSGRTAHSTIKSGARAFLEDRIRQSPYLMELIIRSFYYDYKLLHYPLPNLDQLP
ncbi:hypothetical protein TELCIR_17286 [Teladorsagia circumcincta]|uniref:Uncharacterized protein n=1 Tax=Teladorsagia circumcincta TaxID=45464 RepID=A0A2G9TT63_TELCI|nr:hypothetical protein TELCIR_17286 [Teladorsagia circumcincta]